MLKSFFSKKMIKNFLNSYFYIFNKKNIERRMSTRYIAKSVSENQCHYRRFVKALRVGITSIYYRDDENLDEILKIYDQYIFTYIHGIHFFIMQEMEKYIAVTTGTMYQNNLVLIVLFFILDYERGMKRIGFTNSIDYPNEMIATFVHILFKEGFKGDMNGIVDFDCNLLQIIHILGVDRIDLFNRLKLLKNPRISILYQKFPQHISYQPTPEVINIHIPTENDVLRAENQELRRVLQLTLLDITSLQTQKLEILHDRETFRSTIFKLNEEIESLKGKISKMQEESLMDTLTSPRALDRFDMTLLF